MVFKETKIEGVYIVELELIEDERGYFTRVFSKGIFKVAQINQSFTKKKGTIRGIHFQKHPYEEDKLMQCIQGSTYNVAVDLREESETYKKWVGVELKPGKMMLVPKGCANGFQTLEDNTIVQYPVSEEYYPNYEDGIRWDDPSLNIEWPIKEVIVSDKDKNWEYINVV